MPIPPSLNRRALLFLQALLRQAQEGRMRAYHGTTMENAQRIMSEGFRVQRGPELIREVYARHSIDPATIPPAIRKWIEGEAALRSRTGELGQVYFSPSLDVASRFAGIGETAQIMDRNLRLYLEALRRGYKAQSPNWLMETGKVNIPWRELGPKAVIKAKVPLDPVNQMRWVEDLKRMIKWTGTQSPESGLLPIPPYTMYGSLIGRGGSRALEGRPLNPGMLFGKPRQATYSEISVPEEVLPKIELQKLIRLAGLIAPLLGGVVAAKSQD